MNRLLRAAAAAVILLILIPLQAQAEQLLIPVGRVIGLTLQSGSVTVAAFDDALGASARRAGLRIGDEIMKIDDREVTSAQDVRLALESSGPYVSLTLRRGGKIRTVNMQTASQDGSPRLGVYLRQGISGIGTVTWYDPETGLFGTLGHGVSDGKGNLLNMTSGQAYNAEIVSVEKGKCGEPGQLKGSADPESICGTLLRNTPQGVFGKSRQGWKGEVLPVAQYEDIQVGEAVILSTVDNGSPQEYSVEILKIYPEERSDCRNLLIRITDKQLLAATGGIVQGMSGSPIIQNGKLVGAVTHVLVNSPDTGYGIFIENMLDAAG
ncbi:MAG: PDZ domain-containing protein [Oscillospiraceae bacterium]|nr:PDZ domain-containing protein [Oscillospiraceae bacterium]